MTEYEEEHPAFIGSIGIVRRFVDDIEQWLTVWDEEAKVYRLTQSDREEDETFRDCLHKSLAAELHLDPKKDYIISGLSMAHHQAPIEWPDAETPQWVIVQFFPIQLYGQAGRNKVDQLAHARWQTLFEIAQGHTSEGKPLHARQRVLIERTDLIPAQIRANL